MSVIDLKTIDLSHFKIKQSYMTSKKKTILANIKYYSSNFIIQTPVALILSPPSININKKFYQTSLFYEHYKFNKKIKYFVDKINEIEYYLLDKLQTKCKYINSIKSSNKDNVFFNLKLQMFNSKPVLSIFDKNKQKKSLEYILPRSRAISIIYLKEIWISNNKIGFNWILLQTKIYLPFLYIEECLITEEIEKKGNNTCFDKYTKMLKMGVPLKAIEFELEKNNLSINKFMSLHNRTHKNSSEKKFIKPKINPSMLLGIKLKKNKRKKKNKEKQILAKIDTSKYRPPTKDQLSDILKSLKKIS